MKRYIGTKIIQAEPQAKNYGDPATHGQPGYKVVYPDGYTSWSPAAAFEEAYREASGLPFGLAVEALKKGGRVARAGWNGKGMWLALIPGDQWGIGGQAPYDTPDAPHVQHAPFIGMKTADDKFVPWLASQTDVLAEDWSIVGEG